MKFSELWLREWVNPPVSTAELAHQLTMAGLEVDSVTPVAGSFTGVVVGYVQQRERHPDAEKLSVCTVDVGGETPLQIVCGAANVAAGMKVPVATVGAVLPGDFKIKRAKLRGVESLGMICSAKELGLAESSDGILPLAADAPVGQDFRAWMALEDQAIEVDLTPDRGDCLGIAGLAREIGVINRSPVTPPIIEPVAATHDQRFPVSLEAPAACPRYACRIIRGIDPKAITPLWMQERLRRSGIRSISAVVDVTNYVMLELGQPMHGFDLARLDSQIRVRMANPGEKLTLLDGKELELRPDSLVIADVHRALALAGIMGGEASGVGEGTTDILFESAFFAPAIAAGKARSYGLHTDSSHRFERGVDPGLQVRALERATRLLIDIAGGEPGPVVDIVSPEHLEQRPLINLRRERVRRILGLTIDDATIMDILTRLEMEVSAIEGGWQVKAPSCRFDIGIEVDLIEEIGRIYGYTEIPPSHGSAHTIMRGERETSFVLEQAKQLLVDRDYQEAITYSFIDPEIQKLIDPEQPPIPVANPISSDMAVMRTSLWPGLLQAVRYNQARQQVRLRLFEAGLRFVTAPDGIEQRRMLAGLVTGSAEPEQWGLQARPVDIFDLKGELEAILGLTGAGSAFQFVATLHPALHPGQSARISRDGQPIGWLGMLHPEIEKRLGLAGRTYLFEIFVDRGLEGRLPAFRPLSRFPVTRRDLAIVVDQTVTYGQIKESIHRQASEILQDILLFDVYNGEKIGSGKKSLALGLNFQGYQENITDSAVDAQVETILEALRTELKAQLRE